MKTQNMLILAYIKTFGFSVNAILFYDEKESFQEKIINLASVLFNFPYETSVLLYLLKDILNVFGKVK